MNHGAHLAVGSLLAAKYRIESLLGSGGMAVVYAGRHLTIDQPVAIKVMHRHLLASESMVERFQREARSASKIRGPHSVAVLDIDRLASGETFIVMELLSGEDLEKRLERVARLPYWEATDLLLQACEGVRAAHELGIIHRDLKPSNLFLCERAGSPLVKVLDFGIARACTPDGAKPVTLTLGDAVLGSPQYMAPEQMLDARDVDERADIWSLGCTLYRALSGAPPFPGDNLPEVCAGVLTGTPARPTEVEPPVPEGLWEVALMAMQKDRTRRFASVSALVSALAPFARRLPAAQPPLIHAELPGPLPAQGAARPQAIKYGDWSRGYPAPVPAPRRSLLVALVAIVAALLGATLAVGILLHVRDADDDQPRRSRRATGAATTNDAERSSSKVTPTVAATVAPTAPAVPAVDWVRRTVPDMGRKQLRARAERAGFGVTSVVEDRDPAYRRITLTVDRPPCTGAALYFEFVDLDIAVGSVPLYRRLAGARVLRSERRVIQVSLRAPPSFEVHAGCTDTLAAAITD